MELIKDKVYKRTVLHEAFGGQRQGGISTPSEHAMVFLFTGQGGKKFGYNFDGPRPDGTFWYTGEGQDGDQVMLRGNQAIRDHVAEGKTLHVFEEGKQSGYVRYRGEYTYRAHQTRLAKDRTGMWRNVFVFELEAVD